MSMPEIEKRLTEQPVFRYIEFPGLPNLTDSKLLPGERARLEALRGITSTGEFFAKVSKTAADISNKFIPTGIDQEKARKVLNSTDFSGVSSTDKEYDKLLTVAFVKTSIERQIVRSLIKERKDSLDLTATERVILVSSMDLGDQFDRFYWQWRQNVVTSPLGLKLNELREQNPHAPKQYFLQHCTKLPESKFLYVTFNQKIDGKIETVPYSKEFPQPIDAISAIVNNMVVDLRSVTPKDEKEDKERLGLINYYRTFARSLTCDDPELLEEEFKKLDEDWFEIQGRMQPGHMMEYYMDPLGMRINPEHLIMFRDDRYNELNHKINETKKQTIGFLERDFGHLKAFPPSKKPMEDSVLGIYSALASGKVDFVYAGQNVPNREDVKLRKGVKIFLNLEAMRSAEDERKRLLIRLFGEDCVENHFTTMDKITNNSVAVRSPGHEVAHNFLMGENTRKVIGDYPIEEHKADMAGTLVAAEFLDMPEQQISLQTLLASCIMRMNYRDNDSEKQYYNAALCYLKTMHAIGMIKEGDKKNDWAFADDPDKVKAFFTETRKIFAELAQVYDTLDPDNAQAFTDKYYKEDPSFIIALHEKLGLKPRVSKVDSEVRKEEIIYKN